MLDKSPAKLKKVTVSLPFGIGTAEWEADETQRQAAWSLYVELVTRVTVQSLPADQGLLRESLTSLYSLFTITRQILKESGPGVGSSRESVGGIAIAVLIQGISPFLSKWHPDLQEWEFQRLPETSPREHEKKWIAEPRLRNELEILRKDLEQYVTALEIISTSKK